MKGLLTGVVFTLAIGVCSAQAATTYIPTFTCTGNCDTIPTAGAVSFPSPIVFENWFVSSIVGIDLGPLDLPTDTYTWINSIEPDPVPQLADWTLSITDLTTGDAPSESGTVGVDPITFMSFADSGTLTFLPSGGTTPGVPESSTWAMMLLGFLGLGFAFRQSRRKVAFA
jgi:hypothetical protein